MITQEFVNNLLTVPYYFIGLTLLTGLIKFRSLVPLQRLVFYLVLAAGLTELISTLLWHRSINNLPLFHLYAVVEFLILSHIYRWKLQPLVPEKWMKVVQVLFILFAIFNTLFLQKLTEFNSHVITLSSVIFVILSLLYFYQLLKETKYQRLEKTPMFWVNVGVLLYFSSSIVLFHASNYLIPESLQVWGAAWGIHAIFNVFHYLAFCIALWVKPAK